MSADNSSLTTTDDRLWDYSRRIARATSVEQLAKLREEIRRSRVGELDWDYLSRKLDSFKNDLYAYTLHQNKMRVMDLNREYRVRRVQRQLRQITKDTQRAAEELNSIVEQESTDLPVALEPKHELPHGLLLGIVKVLVPGAFRA